MRNQSLQEEASSNSPSSFYIAQQVKNGSVNNNPPGASEDIPDDKWIKDYFENDYETALVVLQLFIDEMLPEINELESVLFRNVEELRRKVHKINPSFKMIGLGALAAALKDIENNCSATPDLQDLHYKIKVVQARTEKARPFILNQYQTISKLAQ